VARWLFSYFSVCFFPYLISFMFFFLSLPVSLSLFLSRPFSQMRFFQFVLGDSRVIIVDSLEEFFQVLEGYWKCDQDSLKFSNAIRDALKDRRDPVTPKAK